MFAIVSANLSVFPEWLQSLIITAWGLFLLAVPIVGLVKLLQTPSMRKFLRAIPGAVKAVGRFLAEQATDPIRHPRIERIVGYGSVAHSYLMSFTLFLYFVFMIILWGMTDKHLSPLQHIGILGYSFLCVYLAAVLKAQASKELLRLRGNKTA